MITETKKINQTKNTAKNDGAFGVDPVGFAPASSCGNNEMLRIYTTGPGPRDYSKIEKAPFQGLFLSHTSLSVVLRTPRCIPIIHSSKTMSMTSVNKILRIKSKNILKNQQRKWHLAAKPPSEEIVNQKEPFYKDSFC